MTWMQLGILLDAVGFLLVFLFGGFSFGLDLVHVGKSWWVVPCKVIGGALVIAGFGAMYIGQNPVLAQSIQLPPPLDFIDSR